VKKQVQMLVRKGNKRKEDRKSLVTTMEINMKYAARGKTAQ